MRENIFIAEYGPADATTFVFLHGNPGDHRDLHPQMIAEISKKNRLIVIDRPGHGDSRRVSGNFDIPSQTQWLSDLWDELKIKSAVIIGYSWSGGLALEMAKRFPQKVDGLLLLSPWAYARDEDQAPTALIKILEFPFFGKAVHSLLQKTLKKSINAHLEKVFGSCPPSFESDVAVYTTYSRTLQMLKDKASLLDSLGENYSSIKIKTLIVGDRNDQIFSYEEQFQRLNSEILNSHLLTTQNLGHALPQNPESWIKDALKYFESTSSERKKVYA